MRLLILIFLGFVGLGIWGSMSKPRPAVPPRTAAPAPTIAPASIPAPVPAAPPVADIRFGLTEEKRIEINNARWQAGMWAHEEANRLYPFAKIDEATSRDVTEGRKLEAERHGLYESCKKIALALVAKKYALGEDVLAKIDEEGGQKKWTVSETPVLFGPLDKRRATQIAKTGIDPLDDKPIAVWTKEDETKLIASEERYRTVEKRRQKRAARR
jgi:hypothetical protein